MLGQLWIIAAPSGGGKTSLIREMCRRLPFVVESVSHTTRAPRSGEREGLDYFFIDEDEFQRRIAAGDFLEWASVYGRHYGTSRSQVEARLQAGQDVLLNIDWQGAQQVRQLLPATRTVFLLPPSLETLLERLRSRGDDPEHIERRMAEAVADISHYREFEFVLVNEDWQRACDQLELLLRSARLLRSRQEADLQPLLQRLGQGPRT